MNTIRLFLSILFLLPFNYKVTKLETLGISGEICMVRENKDIPITLKFVSGHPYNEVKINILVDGKIVNKYTVISKYIDDTYYIPALYAINKKFHVRIEAFYTNSTSTISYVEFDFYTPSFEDITLLNTGGYKEFKPSNYTKLSFYMKGSFSNTSVSKEWLSYQGKNVYYVSKDRYVDFSSFYFTLYGIDDFSLDYVTIKIGYEFIKSDLEVDNGYTIFTQPIKSLGNNKYCISDDYQFYMSKKTGSIMYEYSNETYKDLLPFFIPLYVDSDLEIPYFIILDDVGLNHNTYIFKGVISTSGDYLDTNFFGGVMNYAYKEVKDSLTNIRYE